MSVWYRKILLLGHSFVCFAFYAYASEEHETFSKHEEQLYEYSEDSEYKGEHKDQLTWLVREDHGLFVTDCLHSCARYALEVDDHSSLIDAKQLFASSSASPVIVASMLYALPSFQEKWWLSRLWHSSVRYMKKIALFFAGGLAVVGYVQGKEDNHVFASLLPLSKKHFGRITLPEALGRGGNRFAGGPRMIGISLFKNESVRDEDGREETLERVVSPGMPMEEEAFYSFVNSFKREMAQQGLWRRRRAYLDYLNKIINEDTFEDIVNLGEFDFFREQSQSQGKDELDLLKWSYIQYYKAMAYSSHFQQTGEKRQEEKAFVADIYHRFQIPSVAQSVFMVNIPADLARYMNYQTFKITVALAGTSMQSWYDYMEWVQMEWKYKNVFIDVDTLRKTVYHLAEFVEGLGMPFKTYKSTVAYMNSWEEYFRWVEAYKQDRLVNTTLVLLAELKQEFHDLWSHLTLERVTLERVAKDAKR